MSAVVSALVTWGEFDQVTAERDEALQCLSAVMRSLDVAAGSPTENVAYKRAYDLLASHGMGDAAIRHRQQCEAWEARERTRGGG